MITLGSDLLVVLLSYNLILLQISPSLSQFDGRIVGGVPTTIDKAPYLVQLRAKDTFFCAGTLVSEYAVISAAHCFDENRKGIIVVGGATNIYNSPGTARSQVSKVVTPKAYTSKTYHMDVAVIMLKKALKGRLIQPISLQCDEWKEGSKVQLFGWGKLNEGDKSIPIQLQTVFVRAIDNEWCRWLYKGYRNVTDAMFCASTEAKDACSGDSGGPAIVNNQFCGVISWGRGCARAYKPGVYTNMSKVVDFVKRVMDKFLIIS